MRVLKRFWRCYLFTLLSVSLFVCSHAKVLAATDMSQWMGLLLQDQQPLSLLSIPGTHDSAAYKMNGLSVFATSWAKTQDWSVSQQLEAGIRYLDFRIAMDGSMHHGSAWVGEDFASHLREVKNFLTSHPSEFVLIRIKPEYVTFGGGDDYLKYREMVLKNLITDSQVVDKLYLDRKEPLPRVGDVRGKIILIDDAFGLLEDVSAYTWNQNLLIQDVYDNLDGATKWQYMMATVKEANTNPQGLTINHTSHTQGAWSLSSIAYAMSQKLASWLPQASQTYDILGVMPMDFPTAPNIEHIIQVNQSSAVIYQALSQFDAAIATVAGQLPGDTNQDGIVSLEEKEAIDHHISSLESLVTQINQKIAGLHSPYVKQLLDEEVKKRSLPSSPTAFDISPYEQLLNQTDKLAQDLSMLKQEIYQDGILTVDEEQTFQAKRSALLQARETLIKEIAAIPAGRKHDAMLAAAKAIALADLDHVLSIHFKSGQAFINHIEDYLTQGSVALTDDQGAVAYAFQLDDLSFQNGSGQVVAEPRQAGDYTVSLSAKGLQTLAAFALERQQVLWFPSEKATLRLIEPVNTGTRVSSAPSLIFWLPCLLLGCAIYCRLGLMVSFVLRMFKR